jgi:hypothetical protein
MRNERGAVILDSADDSRKKAQDAQGKQVGENRGCTSLVQAAISVTPFPSAPFAPLCGSTAPFRVSVSRGFSWVLDNMSANGFTLIQNQVNEGYIP